MNSEKIKETIRQNFVFYMLGLLVLVGMKFFYSGAGCDQLKWLLAPTAKWVEVLSGLSFFYEPGAGYVNHGLRISIAPSCSGFRFMTIVFAMLSFSFLHRTGRSGKDGAGAFSESVKNHLKKGGWLLSSLLLSCVLTVLVNGLRIIAALYLPDFLGRADLPLAFLTPDRLHTLIGILVYFMALLAIYRLAAYFFGDKALSPVSALAKCLPPLFWYFFFTLGIPFLGRAYEGKNVEFAEYALLILSGCGILLLPHLLTFAVKTGLSGFRNRCFLHQHCRSLHSLYSLIGNYFRS